MRYLLLLLLIGCSQVPEDSGSINVLFCPSDCNISLDIHDARCAFYDWDEGVISLGNTSVVLDERAPYFHGAVVAPKGHQMHNKFCVLGDQIVMTGSMNPTVRGMHYNNNNLLVIESEHLAKNYLDEFEELSARTFAGGKGVRHNKVLVNGTLVENYFCPEDCLPGIFTDLLDSANDSVYFLAFSFTHDDIGDALVSAHNRGVSIKGVMEKSQNSKWCEYEKLRQAGIDVQWDTNKANMHHKVFIIDEKIVITGSANPSRNGLEKNDENILVIHSQRIAKLYVDEFNRLRII